MSDNPPLPANKPPTPSLMASPLLRAAVPICLGILPNVFAGEYIFEITRTAADSHTYLAWSETFHSIGFWLLLSLALCGGIYLWVSIKYERRRENDILEYRNENLILAKLYEAQLRARIAEIEGGKSYTFAELKEMVFGKDEEK